MEKIKAQGKEGSEQFKQLETSYQPNTVAMRENSKQGKELGSYYHYLHGLDGLSGWGYDEQLLSTKVWLEGGRCVLLKELEIGHVYRMSFPYAVSGTPFKEQTYSDYAVHPRIAWTVYKAFKRYQHTVDPGINSQGLDPCRKEISKTNFHPKHGFYL